MIGIVDMHCWNCGNVQFRAARNCDRCGGPMTSWAPLEEKSLALEADWLKTPMGIAWRKQQIVSPPAEHPALIWFDNEEWNSWELATVPVTGHGREALATALDALQPGTYRITLIGPGQQRAYLVFDEAEEGQEL
jgi:hypothetical protein